MAADAGDEGVRPARLGRAGGLGGAWVACGWENRGVVATG